MSDFTYAGEVLYVCWRFTYAGEVLYVCWRFTYAGDFTYAGATRVRTGVDEGVVEHITRTGVEVIEGVGELRGTMVGLLDMMASGSSLRRYR